MAITALPDVPFTATLESAPTGMAGSIGAQITDSTETTVIVARTTSGITESVTIPGTYNITFAGLPNATFGSLSYKVVWDYSSVFVSEDLTVVAPQAVSGNLLSFSEYLVRMGLAPGDVDANEQAQIEADIAAASMAIRSHTDRDFMLVTDALQVPKQFRYDGTGIVDIDDASAVTTVSLATTPWNVGRTLDVTEWIAGPFNKPILEYLEVWSKFYPSSPAMGFNRNEDNPLYPRGYGPVIIEVDAVWGWTSIPEDVKQAMIWVVASLRSDPSPYTSESIESYSWTKRWSLPDAITDRAQAILDPYTRINV